MICIISSNTASPLPLPQMTCSLNTSPGVFYSDPCWGRYKKLEVWYECETCDKDRLFKEGAGCLPIGWY